MSRLRVCIAVIALTWGGCVRFGYDGKTREPTAGTKGDSPHRDAGADSGGPGRDAGADARVSDASDDARMPEHDASSSDASMDGGTDAESSDASHDDDDAGNSGAPDRCPERSDSLFCEDFEATDFGRWDYDVLTNGSVERSTSVVANGAGSLRATTGAATGANSAARLGAKAFDRNTSGDLWLRYRYYIPGSTVVNTYFSTGVIAELQPPYFGFSLLIRPDRVDIGSGSVRYQGTMPFPRDQWVCVELHVKVHATDGVFEAYLDGDLAATSPATNTVPAMGYTSVDVGIHFTDPTQGPLEAYVDDVVASRSRVGCVQRVDM